MFKLRSAKVHTITPEDAAVLLKCNYAGQRKVTKRRVDMLQKAMQDKTFRVGCIGIAVEPTGTQHLVNGQHQLTACVKESQSIEALVERFDVQAPEDIALLYRQYDSTISSRSIRDAAEPEFLALNLDWPSKVKSAVLAAIQILTNKGRCRDGGGGCLLPTERISRIIDFVDEGNWVRDIYEGGPEKAQKILLRGPVVAPMIMTLWASDAVFATTFWEPVRDGAFLSEKDPRHHLREFLTQAKGNGNKTKTGSHEIMFRCIAEWNRFADGQKICPRMASYEKSKPVPEAKTPRTMKYANRRDQQTVFGLDVQVSRPETGEPA